jgi:retron-type reverse transcriptase
MIEGDIEKCFDSIDHHILMGLIEKKIKDRKFTRLIWKSLRANHMESKIIKHNIIGTFQGSIISPILANIFLHQLDVFVAYEKKQYDRGQTSRVTTEYNNLRYKERKLREKGQTSEANTIAKTRRDIPYSNFSDDNYKRLSYVRYADDWLIGVKGTKEEAEQIRNKVRDFLASIKLKLSESKTKTTNVNVSKVLFLGTTITRAKHTKYSRIGTILKRNPRRLRMEAPLIRVKAKLKEAGFIKKGKSYPKFV